MNLLEATYVQLRGVANIGGRSTSNLDPARDGCVVHLHEETGGVFVTYEGSSHGEAGSMAHSHYIAGVGIESVDLKDALVPVRYITPAPPSFAPQVAQAELDEKTNAEARDENARKPEDNTTLADDVLAEFQDADAKPHPRRKKK